ncbi:MAG: leucine-rich repeat domain-containing protein [Lachnospiraceae bacterium]|nr:leucine-rich repeat domain-containing protein [Lachnospiraceae bacterium]
MSQNTCLELLPLPTRNGNMERWFYFCTILSYFLLQWVIQAQHFSASLLYYFILRLQRIGLFTFAKECFFMYSNDIYSQEERVVTRKNAHLYLASDTQIPAHVRRIAKEAFQRRSIIETVRLPKGLTSIGQRAFNGCASLQEISIPSQVSELGSESFSNCDVLKTAQIAGSASTIPQGMFQEDRKLTTVCFHPQSQIQKIQKRAFSECKSLATLILPPGLTEINDRAFYRCKSLDAVRLPDHLRKIGGQAFYFCGFSSIEFPNSLEVLEESAFFKCTQLTYVRIPESVRFIGKWAFHGCNRLQYLEIRHDPDFIGEWIINRSATIRCYQGSKVDQYCQAAGFKVEYL